MVCADELCVADVGIAAVDTGAEGLDLRFLLGTFLTGAATGTDGVLEDAAGITIPGMLPISIGIALLALAGAFCACAAHGNTVIKAAIKSERRITVEVTLHSVLMTPPLRASSPLACDKACGSDRPSDRDYRH